MTKEEPSAPKKTRRKMWVEYPDGTHLSRSGEPGGYSSLARDDETNDLETHAVLFEINDNEDSAEYSAPTSGYLFDESASDSRSEEDREFERLLVAIIALCAIEAGKKLAPHAIKWWNEQARPSIRSAWTRIGRARKVDDSPVAKAAIPLGPVPATPSQSVAAAIEVYRASISSEEARARLTTALAAGIFSEEQMRILRNARIEGHSDPSELIGAIGSLTPEQLEDGRKFILERRLELLGEDTSVTPQSTDS